MNIDIIYSESETISIPTGMDKEVLIIDVKMTKLLWKLGFSKSVMHTDVLYTVSNNQVYNIKGSHKVLGGGNTSNNVKKALKNTTYKFLKELEK